MDQSYLKENAFTTYGHPVYGLTMQEMKSLPRESRQLLYNVRLRAQAAARKCVSLKHSPFYLIRNAHNF